MFTRGEITYYTWIWMITASLLGPYILIAHIFSIFKAFSDRRYIKIKRNERLKAVEETKAKLKRRLTGVPNQMYSPKLNSGNNALAPASCSDTEMLLLRHQDEESGHFSSPAPDSYQETTVSSASDVLLNSPALFGAHTTPSNYNILSVRTNPLQGQHQKSIMDSSVGFQHSTPNISVEWRSGSAVQKSKRVAFCKDTVPEEEDNDSYRQSHRRSKIIAWLASWTGRGREHMVEEKSASCRPELDSRRKTTYKQIFRCRRSSDESV